MKNQCHFAWLICGKIVLEHVFNESFMHLARRVCCNWFRGYRWGLFVHLNNRRWRPKAHDKKSRHNDRVNLVAKNHVPLWSNLYLKSIFSTIQPFVIGMRNKRLPVLLAWSNKSQKLLLYLHPVRDHFPPNACRYVRSETNFNDLSNGASSWKKVKMILMTRDLFNKTFYSSCIFCQTHYESLTSIHRIED